MSHPLLVMVEIFQKPLALFFYPHFLQLTNQPLLP